jgi:hypothetical protein
MKFATILSIAFIAVPTLAISSEHYERNYNVAESDLYDREADENVTELTREDFIDMFGRDVVEDLEGRSPLIFGAIRAGFRIGRLVYKAGRARKLFRRDLEFDEDLETREPTKGARTAIRLFRGTNKVASGAQHTHDVYQPGKREVLEEREFDEDEMFEREFDDDEEYYEREFDDLD